MQLRRDHTDLKKKKSAFKYCNHFIKHADTTRAREGIRNTAVIPRKGQVRASPRSLVWNLTPPLPRGQFATRCAPSPKIAAEAALDQDPPLIHPGVKEHHRSSFCLASAQLNSTSGRLFHKSHPVPNTRAFSSTAFPRLFLQPRNDSPLFISM